MQSLATALDIPLSTVERWARQGRIPIQRKGNEAIFSRAALNRWASIHQLTFDLDNSPNDNPSSETFDTLLAVMKRGNVFHHLKGNDKNEVLRSVVNCIDFFPSDVQNELLEKLLAREQLASTGIGNGIAIPHPRDPISRAPASPFISTCFLEKPTPFSAIDDQPVSILFLLISPTVKHHLHLLSRLSYCIRDKAFVAFLHTRPEPQALFSHVGALEKQLDEH